MFLRKGLEEQLEAMKQERFSPRPQAIDKPNPIVTLLLEQSITKKSEDFPDVIFSINQDD
jgi:hypothetical protein